MNERHKTKGFTLIELLIVVAIIAILAAIAVPNFLEAQTRSKVARVKADMRTTTTALESYFVDWNRYPYHGDKNDPAFVIASARQVLSHIVTTPVAYLTSLEATSEPFTSGESNANPFIEWQRTHVNYACFQAPWGTDDAARNFAQRVYSFWRLTSAGPDRKYFNSDLSPTGGTFLVVEYDPSNGTVSVGDIMRTQRDAEFKVKP